MTNHKNTFNLIDIAKRAGVSRSTVSRVINDDPHVSDKTRARVLKVINEVGYVPNAAARMLRTQRTQIIGVVIPGSLSDVFASDNPHYHATIIQAISEFLQQRDYAMLLWVNSMDESAERFYKRMLRKSVMDGLVIVSSLSNEATFVTELMSQNLPFSLMGYPIDYADAINYVAIDNVAAAKNAVEHLIQKGHQRIGTITGDDHNIDSQERLEGYRLALQDAKLPYNPHLVEHGRFNRIRGYEKMQLLLEQNVDAVFAASDIIAAGAIEAINDAGLRVPEDIAIIGFDDLPIAQEITPSLTTVRHPIDEKARHAVELLINKIENPDAPVESRILPTELIIRESCGTQTTQ